MRRNKKEEVEDKKCEIGVKRNERKKNSWEKVRMRMNRKKREKEQ